MALLFLTFAFACQNGQVVSRKIEGCYHEASLSQLLNETRIDPIEVRWVNGVEEICRYSDGQIEVHHPKKTNATCSPNDLCFDLPAEVFEPVPPAEVSTAIFGSEKKMYWSKNSLSKKLKAMDDDWAVEMLARYGGASRLDDGTELSLISPAQVFIDGEHVYLEQVKCLVMRDIHPPHQTLCLFEQNGTGYAHVGKWVRVNRAGLTGLDARRAYGMDGGSKSYLNNSSGTGGL